MGGGIASDGAADEGERPIVVDAPSIMGDAIAGNGAADEGERPIIRDGAAIIRLAISRPVASPDAVGERERPSIVDEARLQRYLPNHARRAPPPPLHPKI